MEQLIGPHDAIVVESLGDGVVTLKEVEWGQARPLERISLTLAELKALIEWVETNWDELV